MPNTIKTMIDPADAVMLLIDHQSGLFQRVKDIDMLRLRHNVSALAKVSRLAKLPTFTTASVPDGPNGPLIPEIHRYNPDAIHIPRRGQINAWDNPQWVEAIHKTGRKTLLITDAANHTAFAAGAKAPEGFTVTCVPNVIGVAHHWDLRPDFKLESLSKNW